MTDAATDIHATLAALADAPPARWPALVAARWPDDPALAGQALVWLHAQRERGAEDDGRPALDDDRYEIGVLLDVGATAEVWQAHDRKLGRNVAVKVFRGTRAALGPALLAGILAEARAAAEVTSDHVVRVLDVHDGAPAYIVLELVGEYEPRRGALTPGASAATLRPSSIAEAVRWVRDVARGVHDAHLRNVFHRDLKPHNVLVTPWSRRARVADFGLALSAGQPSGAGLQIAGTPGYMAPEQAAGLRAALDPHDVDDRAVLVALDVWGAGAVAYDLLTGRPPWRAADGLEAWERAATATESPALGADVPRRLRRIVARALAVDPRARYATAAALADDLDAYLRREPTSFDTGRLARGALWCRRNPQLTLTAGLASVLAALTLVAYASVVESRAQRTALVAEAAEAQAENVQLEARAKAERVALAGIEAELAAAGTQLTGLRSTLTDTRAEYQAIVAAKDRALHDADAATRQLGEALAAMRSERDTARLGSSMYEGFWARARAEADDAARARDATQRELADAIAARDEAAKERAEQAAARGLAEQQRDRAIADRDRAEASRRQLESDLARLAADLAGLRGHRDAGSGAGSAGSGVAAPSPPGDAAVAASGAAR